MSEREAPARAVTVAGFGAFTLLGVVVGSFGPSIPHVAARFSLSVSVAGLIVTSYFCGECLGILGLGLTHTRWSLGGRLAVASGLVSVGLLASAIAPAWPLLLASIFVLGTGAGGLVVLLNLYFATRFGRRSPAMVSFANVAYGVGTFVGPALIGVVRGYSPVFAGVAVAWLACLAVLRGATDEVAIATLRPTITAHRTLRLVVAFAVLLFLYEALEVGVGTWETTDLVALGSSTAFATGATSLYYAMFTIGRVIAAPLAVRYSPQRLLIPAFVVAIVLLVAIHLRVSPPILFALVGLCAAPAFPVVVSWMADAIPNATSAATYVILGAVVGSAVIPAGLGAVIAVAGIDAFPLGVAVCALACVGMVALISLRLRT
jgi:FHS family glucose/mannose:H+ symporter-like MFS transporter